MPFKDPEKNRVYQRNWARQKLAGDPEGESARRRTVALKSSRKHKLRHRVRAKAWRKNNPEKAALLDARKGARRHGITLEQRQRLEASQKNRCAICKRREAATIRGKVKRLAVDHCHATNAVRGLLCANCNRALGLFADNVESLRRAVAYLVNPPALRVLGQLRQT